MYRIIQFLRTIAKVSLKHNTRKNDERVCQNILSDSMSNNVKVTTAIRKRES